MAEKKKKELSAEELIKEAETAEEGREVVIEKKPGIMKRIVSRIVGARRYGMSPERYKKIMGAEAKRRQRAKLIASIRRVPVGISRRRVVPIQRAAQMLFPYAKMRMPMYPEERVRAVSPGRGRPAGTYKYGMPIQQYKKLLRAARAKARAARIITMAQARARGITTRAVYPPQAQYVLPESEQVLPEQIIQQQPTPPLKRPIIPVFKSMGGSPYPPVADRPLQAQGEYYEDVDLMSGKRIIRRRLPREAWTQ